MLKFVNQFFLSSFNFFFNFFCSEGLNTLSVATNGEKNIIPETTTPRLERKHDFFYRNYLKWELDYRELKKN